MRPVFINASNVRESRSLERDGAEVQGMDKTEVVDNQLTGRRTSMPEEDLRYRILDIRYRILGIRWQVKGLGFYLYFTCVLDGSNASNVRGRGGAAADMLY